MLVLPVAVEFQAKLCYDSHLASYLVEQEEEESELL